MSNYTKEDYLLIENSEFFDREWYIAKYSSLEKKINNPIEHYLCQGWIDGNNPSLNFDGNKYLNAYKTVAKIGMNPLLHYELYGKKLGLEVFSTNDYSADDYELIKQSSFFDPEWYKCYDKSVDWEKIDPAVHYLDDGWLQGKNPSRNFDGKKYLEHYKTVADARMNPLLHYEKYGKFSGIKVFPVFEISEEDCKLISESKYFDRCWYLQQFPDLKSKGIDPIKHYLTYGEIEGVNPSKFFDGHDYLERYKTVAKAHINPLLHYEKYGKKAGLKVLGVHGISYEDYALIKNSCFFDCAWYSNQNINLGVGDVDPIEHYLTVGWVQGRNPSESFDGKKYLSHYKTVESSKMNPLLHYEKYGKKAGLKTFRATKINKLFSLIHKAHLLSDLAYMDKCNVEIDYILLEKSKLFDAKYYSEKYNTSHASDFNPIEHYLYTGWKEGCNPSSRFDTNFYLSTYKSVKESGVNPLVHYEKVGKHQNLRTLGASVTFPKDAKCQKLVKLSNASEIKRIAVFASFSSNGIIADYVVYYLKQLKKVCDGIVFICDAPLFDGEFSKIKDFIIYACAQRHEEYDFGSYKRGYQFLKESQLLGSLNELIFCNDSCYGPVYDMTEMFHNKSCLNSDFWGILPSDEIRFHLQSWFLCFKRNVFTSDVFDSFITSVKKEYSVKDVILNYETHYTRALIEAGFKYGSVISFKANDKKYPYKFGHNLSLFPIYLLEHGCPFVKVKALTKLGCNYEGVKKTLDYIKEKNESLYKLLPRVNQSNSIKFSIIMPTFNRASLIMDAIDSVLAQTYDNFELIIVDDGSTDNTESLIREHYKKELEKKIIVYVKKTNEGVCKARNYGLRMVSNEWIAYADSDNLMFPHFLESFATEIENNSNYKVFYSMFRNRKSHKIIGSSFDYRRLIKENYIDMGTLVHHRSLLQEIGCFDENMTRLVDWDLILRYTSKYTPHYTPIPLMLYNDTNGISRISNSVSYENNLNYFRNKHKSFGLKKVTTVITAYNHEKYIEQAIKSAVNQKGWFEHEILISDDFSTDGTPSIVEKYCKKFPLMVKNISSDRNLGISQNLKKCFESATGDYVAILEGDDYWTDEHKLEKQMIFLEKNRDCSMVFSKLKLLNETTQKFSSLSRQNNLRKSKLTGNDVINEPTLNFMGNFSCCMFRSQIMKNLPNDLYTTRINEISLSFYLVKFGKIGYISEPLSVYRQHTQGIWTGADKAKQLESGLKCREAALNVCQDKFKKRLQQIIDVNYKLPLEKILSESNHESTNCTPKFDTGIKGWLSSSLNKDNELFGYLLNINNQNIRQAVIKIGENIEYECLSDRIRSAPKNYLYHRNHGFRVKLDEYITRSINTGEKLRLIDKETGKIVYTTLFKR